MNVRRYMITPKISFSDKFEGVALCSPNNDVSYHLTRGRRELLTVFMVSVPAVRNVKYNAGCFFFEHIAKMAAYSAGGFSCFH